MGPDIDDRRLRGAPGAIERTARRLVTSVSTRDRSVGTRSDRGARHRDLVRRDGGRGRRRRHRRSVSSVVSSQIDLHARYGGVVPELAGRAHLELLTPVMADALDRAGSDPGHRASTPWPPPTARVSSAPCWSGVAEAKALALAWDVPFVGVNHLEAHLFAALLDQPDLDWPLVVLLVSGGHTMLVEVKGPGRYRLLGQTLDDAAGEAFDKVARFLGLGYPGRPGHRAGGRGGRPRRLRLPPGAAGRRARPLLQRAQDRGRQHGARSTPRPSNEDVAASFQQAVVDVLVAKARPGRRRRRGQGALPGRRGGGQRRRCGPPCRGRPGRGRHRRLPAQPGDVHRQRRHGRRRRLVAARTPGPEPPRRSGADPNLRLVPRPDSG